MMIDECESTNTVLKKLGEEGAPHGSWVSARIQTQGRGRSGRKWEAQPGNLFLSVLLRVDQKIPLTWIPLQSGISVVEAVQESTSRYDLKLKWPNDLVVIESGELKKAGGILCEGVGQKNASFVVVGVGLNCKSHPQVDQPTISLGIDVDQIRPKIIESLLRPYSDSQFDRDRVEKNFLKHSAIRPDDFLEWKNHQGKEYSGYFLGLGPMGELQVKVGSEMQSLYSEEIKLKPIRLKDV
jgi:BirA family biotin operon repressor/biotin-[acetyl-CoA-carboxylase] ligase